MYLMKKNNFNCSLRQSCLLSKSFCKSCMFRNFDLLCQFCVNKHTDCCNKCKFKGVIL